MKKKVLIIGAGPAGLTAAVELLRRSPDVSVTVLEQSGRIGGIAATVVHHGNRMDLGGHRFFSKSPEVNAWWEQRMPLQGAPALDDRLLVREVSLAAGGPDPEATDRVMLRRKRISRILFDHRFFDYPVSLTAETLRGLGFGTALAVGWDYLRAAVHPRPEKNLEDFCINRFGKKLYTLFFENYTRTVWGRHPREIAPEWGRQRMKGLSVREVLRHAWGQKVGRKAEKVETSLIGAFFYPKLGPGQLWELVRAEIEALGGQVLLSSPVLRVVRDAGNRVTGVVVRQNGEEVFLEGDCVISSMPLKDLIAGMDGVPEDCARIARGLPYRSCMVLGVLVSRLALQNETGIPTLGNIIPDNWIYVHDRSVRMGRIQIFNNWSPYLAENPRETVWIGLEYFCDEGDALWNLPEEDFLQMAKAEMITLGLIRDGSEVLDAHLERVPKAYPAYFDTYGEIQILREWLDTIPNLYCIGRNGQHRYNNMDHSMMTAFEAVKNILNGDPGKDNLWQVNTEAAYQEAGNPGEGRKPE